VSSSGNLSVSVLQWLTLTQSSREWQEGQQMILLSISGGRSMQHSACCCCNWLTPSPPSPHSPYAVFVIDQAAAATFDTQNTARTPPPTAVAIGLLIAISLSFDSTWSQTISNDLITIKSWSRQALKQTNGLHVHTWYRVVCRGMWNSISSNLQELDILQCWILTVTVYLLSVLLYNMVTLICTFLW